MREFIDCLECQAKEDQPLKQDPRPERFVSPSHLAGVYVQLLA